MSHLSDFTPEKTEIHNDTMVSFSHRLVNSESFKSFFREGMTLVEETAAYLDGDGRQESRLLTRSVALAYATESMRLTTRLMQMASWLLIQRATNEGEMSRDQAMEEKRKIRLSTMRTTVPPDIFLSMPERLRALIAKADRLQERIVLLEKDLNKEEPEGRVENPIQSQLALIHTAFSNVRFDA